MTRDARHLGCPSCGATLPRREDVRTIRCIACGTRCAIVAAVPVVRFQVLPRVTRAESVAKVRDALARWPVRAGAAEAAAVVSCEIVWAPYYELEAVQAGTIVRTLGTTTKRTGHVDWSQGRRRFLDDAGNEIPEHEHYRRREVSVKDTAVLLRQHRVSGVAGGPADWGLGEISIAELREDPDVRFVPRGSRDAPPGAWISIRTGTAEAEAVLRRSVDARAEADVELLSPDLRYVHVPLHVVRLRVGGHPYTFVVDAVRGRILTGRAPEARRRGALFLVLAGAFLGMILGKSVRGAVSHGDGISLHVWLRVLGAALEGGGVLALLVPLVLVMPLAHAWSEFRFRGEVRFGPRGAEVVKLSRPPRTFLDKVVDWLVAAMNRLGEAQADRRRSWWDEP